MLRDFLEAAEEEGGERLGDHAQVILGSEDEGGVLDI